VKFVSLRLHHYGSRRLLQFLVILLSCFALSTHADDFSSLFQSGVTAYRAGDFPQAVASFRKSAAQRPASGTLENLGTAEWRSDQPGPAILAWEQSLWLDPFNKVSRNNLRFARKVLQVEAPEFAWYEVVSTWLPVNWWAWIAGISFWLAIAAAVLPGIFRLPKAGWHQGLAALGLTVFLLSVPAHAGVHTRSRLGFILQKDTPLRLTPTAEAQTVTRLSAGEPARLLRTRGQYLLLRTSRANGWVRAEEFGRLSP
jgi:tetratricopeptide (TPR) repeat protein